VVEAVLVVLWHGPEVAVVQESLKLQQVLP
jgi:hypothetical protein